MAEKTYSQIQKDYREHVRAGAQPMDGAVKISLLSDFTIDPLAAYIWAAAREENIDVCFHIGAYDQYSQEILQQESPLYSFAPDIAFLIFKPGTGEAATRIAASAGSLAGAFRARSKSPLVVSNFITPSMPYRLSEPAHAEAVKQANAELEKELRRIAETRLLDLDGLSAHFGKGRVVNWKLHYMGSIDFSPEFMSVLAKKCMTYIRLLVRAPRKALVLDLDNTLWGGIVGEAGESGIALGKNGPGSEYHDFQKEILELNRRGVLLAVNSKNNPEDALAVLKNHPNMILRPDNFAAMRINWNDKASNMRELAAELNIGLDSFVFLDDNPVERGLVRSSLPEVLVPELPGDPAQYASFIRDLDVFESFGMTEEDAKRSEMYLQQKERDSLREKCATVEDYLKGLNITVTVSRVEDKDIARACQLIMRTNQFNLTTRRHAEADVRDFSSRPDCGMFALRVSDIYGDSGMTGLAILFFENGVCRIDTLLMSCRILGRKIEETFMSVLIGEAGRRAGKIVGEYIPTKKNAQVADFFPKMGFSRCGEGGDAKFYELDIADDVEKPRPCDLHTLILEDFQS